jgi:carbon-monoxide dehydrogenase medium subunit
VKPPRFEYLRPETLGEAVSLLAARPDAKPLAGGQSLIPAMNFRLAAPAALVDLARLEELRGVRAQGDGLRIGALTTHRELEHNPLIAGHAPLLAQAVPHIAHPQIRSRGTLGGSLAHADPAAELPAVMLALGALLELTGPSGTRQVAADDFFLGLFLTALAPGELITAVTLPGRPPRSGDGFQEFARRHGDYALAGVTLRLALDGAGAVHTVRIALFGVGDGPVRAGQAEQALRGRAPDPAARAEAAAIAAEADCDPPSDIHASAAYRRQLVRVLTRRALEAALTRAESSGG